MEANTSGAVEALQQKDIQGVSQQIQAFQKVLPTMQESTQNDLKLNKEYMEGKGSKEEDTAKRSFSDNHLAELEKKIGEHGHSQEGLLLSEGKCWSTEKQFCKQVLLTSSKSMEKDSPFLGSSFYVPETKEC